MRPTNLLGAARLLLLAISLVVPGVASAQETRNVEITFPRGSSGTTVNGNITGYQGVNYRLGVSAGQRMSIQLDTNNASNYFNVAAPGSSDALFNGSISGNSASFVIPSSGTYVINVYLMRNAARRNETASYALTVHVEGSAAWNLGLPPCPAPCRPSYFTRTASNPGQIGGTLFVSGLARQVPCPQASVTAGPPKPV